MWSGRKSLFMVCFTSPGLQSLRQVRANATRGKKLQPALPKITVAKSIQSNPFVPNCNTFAEEDLKIKKAVFSDFMGFGFEAWAPERGIRKGRIFTYLRLHSESGLFTTYDHGPRIQPRSLVPVEIKSG
eukprot:g11841.t1